MLIANMAAPSLAVYHDPFWIVEQIFLCAPNAEEKKKGN